MEIRFLSVLLFSTALITACSHKTTPTNGNNVNAQIAYPNHNNGNTNNTVTPVITDSSTPVPTTTEKILIVLDNGGRQTFTNKTVPPYVIAANKTLPGNQPLTPAQRNNLLSRQNTLLPLALYVPELKSSRSSRGQYYKLKNKYWYWKKSDGYYHLDEIYYQ